MNFDDVLLNVPKTSEGRVLKDSENHDDIRIMKLDLCHCFLKKCSTFILIEYQNSG